MHVIRFEQVWKTYQKGLTARSAHPALRDLSFVLEPGETLGLMGANGAGKSTCIKLLLDFIRPDRGAVHLLGTRPAGHAVARGRIGYLPETANFPSNLNLMDMLRFAGRTCGLTGREIRAASEMRLRRLGLWNDRTRPLRDYSKGMQQRANFAIALLNDPELLILDEPMSGLDPLGRAEILGLISELKSRGASILFCSHILEDVDRVADRVLVLHRSRKIFVGTPAALAGQQGCDTLVDGYLNLIHRLENHAAPN